MAIYAGRSDRAEASAWRTCDTSRSAADQEFYVGTKACCRKRIVAGMSLVYTTGQEGTDIDRFVRTLKAVGVRQFSDVRAFAVSCGQRSGFQSVGVGSSSATDRRSGPPERNLSRAGGHDLHLWSDARKGLVRLLGPLVSPSVSAAEAEGKSWALIRSRDTKFIYKAKKTDQINTERELYWRAARQGSLLNEELAEWKPSP